MIKIWKKVEIWFLGLQIYYHFYRLDSPPSLLSDVEHKYQNLAEIMDGIYHCEKDTANGLANGAIDKGFYNISWSFMFSKGVEKLDL